MSDMNRLITEMQNYCNQISKRSIEIHKVLVEAVKKAGGRIDITDESKDTIYAIVYSEAEEIYRDFKVDCIRVTDDCLEIHIPDIYDDEENQWYSIFGGMVLDRATLVSICEVLPEYLNDM